MRLLEKIKNKLFWFPSILMAGDAILMLFHISLWDSPSLLMKDQLIWPSLIELFFLLIFLFPRTLNIGFYLLCCYWGGLIVADYLNNLSVHLFPLGVLALLALTTYWRDDSGSLSFIDTGKLNQ